jgi:hypothetical protein
MTNTGQFDHDQSSFSDSNSNGDNDGLDMGAYLE